LGALTEWVLDQSLAAVAAIHEEQHPFRISVNVSAASLVDVTFPSKIAAALGRHGLAPERLMIEVTEDAIMTDRLRCIEVLEAIRDHGVELSIDDFGTGHSSLAQVRTLPASELKIDRAFISGIASSKQDADVVKLIIALGKAVQMRVVAEGIETSEVRRLLTDYGCDIAQGFAIGRPMPVEALRQFLATTQTA
ncbi:MAG: EAL domain-containing protein, partial [Patulibacter sp.]|nr:EAL domain-containing protein [Patulibacter sp.]